MVAQIRRLLHRAGVDVTRYPHGTEFGVALAEALRQVATVVDVGAHTGQFSLQARRLGFAGRIVSFEPASLTFQKLSRVAATDPNWSVAQLALGDEEGEASLRLPKAGLDLASLLPWSTAGMRRWEDGGETERIRVATLDTALAPFDANTPLFLKIDTQGFDRRVLAGATRTLERVQALLVELPLQPLYEGAGDWLEMLAWLRERAFYPRWFQPVVFVDGAAAEVDCLLVRLRPSH